MLQIELGAQVECGNSSSKSLSHPLQKVLPALPEEGIPSTVDGAEPRHMSPLDTLEAHQKGAAVMAASPDGRFMATGGADGLVCLWMVYENQVGPTKAAAFGGIRVVWMARRCF